MFLLFLFLCEVVKDISFPTCQLLSPNSVRKSYPRGGKLTFSRCLGVVNLTLAAIKMSNSPGSAHQGVENTKWPASPHILSFVFWAQRKPNATHFRIAWLFLIDMRVWFSWIFSICEIYNKDCRSFSVFNNLTCSRAEKRFKCHITEHGYAVLEIHKAFQDCLTFL